MDGGIPPRALPVLPLPLPPLPPPIIKEPVMGLCVQWNGPLLFMLPYPADAADAATASAAVLADEIMGE